MIQNFIQEQVDILARTLQRSAAVDDVHINLVAVSKHFNDADDARVRAILARTLDEDSIAYLFSFGIRTTPEKIVRIPPCRELGFKERSCYPIRWQDETLGFLWLVGKVKPAEDRAAVACAAELAVPMFSMQLEDEQAFGGREGIVRDLLSVDTRRASRAATILSREGRLRPDKGYRVLCAGARQGARPQHDELAFLRKQIREFSAASDGAERGRPPLFADLPPELLIAVPAESALAHPATLTDIACSGVNSHLKIGIGPEADVLRLYDSYAQASSVLQVLQAIPRLGPCATWEGLGVYGNLALLTRHQEDGPLPMTPGVTALLGEDAALFDTLERFLDNAGNIAKTSADLCIHRSTLYYRLKRIEAITRTDLDSGLDRFTLHLEIKLFRITTAFQDEAAT